MWREQAIIEWSRWSDLGEWPLIMLVNLVNSWLCLLTVTTRVISLGDLYCCLLPLCKALRTCRSGFPIATMMSQKDFVFLQTLHSRVNYHCIHIDQLGSIQPISIGSHSTCKQLHRRSVPRYHSVRWNEILKECKTDESGKSSPRSGKFSRLILA